MVVGSAVLKTAKGCRHGIFAKGLKQARYNTENPNYYTILANQLKTVIKFKQACGVKE